MITVRVVEDRCRLRVRAVDDGKHVQCPTHWRETLPVGVPVQIDAQLRADGACWVYYPKH